MQLDTGGMGMGVWGDGGMGSGWVGVNQRPEGRRIARLFGTQCINFAARSG